MKTGKYLMCLYLVLFTIPMMAQRENSRGRAEQDVSITTPEVHEKQNRRNYKKTFRYKYFKYHSDLIDQYHRRMKKVKRDRKRMARVMKKPQYSDPSYFGHKRKPKKRPVGKMKLCEDCGIRH